MTGDFVSLLIDRSCTYDAQVPSPGGLTSRPVTRLDLESLLQLGEANGCPTAKHRDKLASESLRPQDVGRMRMHVANMLRPRALRRHGLFDLEGKWVPADRDFLVENGAPPQPVESRTGKVLETED